MQESPVIAKAAEIINDADAALASFKEEMRRRQSANAHKKAVDSWKKQKSARNGNKKKRRAQRRARRSNR